MLMHDSLTHYAHIQPELIFASHGERQISYADADVESNRLAHALQNCDLKPGDRVAYLAKNRIDLVLMMFAASKSGVVVVPLNFRLAPPEWAYIIQDAGARLLIVENEFCEGIDLVRGQLDVIEQFICLDNQPPAGWQPYLPWLATGSDSAPLHRARSSDICYQMYTSGTTGHPKGVLISQQNLQNNIHQWVYSLPVRYPVASRTLIVLPLYHAAATLQALVAIQGGHSLIIHHEVDPQAIVNTLCNQDICWTALVPAVIQLCLQSVADIAARDFSSLKTIIYGAAPISSSVLEQALAVFGCDFMQAFGQTEATAVLASLSPQDHRQALQGQPELLRSAGRAFMGTELKIVDPTGNELPCGEVGELIARGPQVMQGYWNLPDATTKTLHDGWLHTGDAASMDEQGYLYIQDRLKDMIVSGGENIYPAEVENALHGHPDVLDAAVIGIPDDDYGETVLAFIVPKPDEKLSEEELQKFCRSHLAGYKIPRLFQFVNELPRNASGKLLKRTLRKPYWTDRERSV